MLARGGEVHVREKGETPPRGKQRLPMPGDLPRFQAQPVSRPASRRRPTPVSQTRQLRPGAFVRGVVTVENNIVGAVERADGIVPDAVPLGIAGEKQGASAAGEIHTVAIEVGFP